jgi:hypothetical protein
VRRLLLRASPAQDRAQLARLNYAQRRVALFLAFSAVTADHVNPADRSDDFVRYLRSALLSDAQFPLLKEVVSYL